MNDASLTLTYFADTEYDGEITASAVSGAFAGRGRAWFDREHIKSTFIEALRRFPLPTDSRPKMEGGVYTKKPPHVLDLCLLRIEIVPYDARKRPLVKVDLSTEPHDTSLGIDRETLQNAALRFLTEYAALDRFAAEFAEVLDGSRKEACLSGEALN